MPSATKVGIGALIILASATPALPSPAVPPCEGAAAAGSPASADEGELERSIVAGPFDRFARRRWGAPRACRIARDGSRLTFSFTYGSGATLEVSLDPAAELSEQRLRARAIDEHAARRLLRAAERAAFGPHGCGVDWSHPLPERAPERRDLFRGRDCNCRGALVYRRGRVVTVEFASAC